MYESMLEGNVFITSMDRNYFLGRDKLGKLRPSTFLRGSTGRVLVQGPHWAGGQHHQQYQNQREQSNQIQQQGQGDGGVPLQVMRVASRSSLSQKSQSDEEDKEPHPRQQHHNKAKKRGAKGR